MRTASFSNFTASKINFKKRKEIRLKDLHEEKETLKSLNNKYKSQFEDIKEKLLNYQETNSKLNEHLKAMDQKNSNSKYQLSAVKNIIRDKNNEITNLKEELISVEFFKNDKDKFTTQINFLERKLSECKGELEIKTKRLRELEKLNTEFRLKSDEYFIENQLIKTDGSHKAYVEMLNGKQKIILKLEKENFILKNEIAKYDKGFEVVLTQSSKNSVREKEMTEFAVGNQVENVNENSYVNNDNNLNSHVNNENNNHINDNNDYKVNINNDNNLNYDNNHNASNHNYVNSNYDNNITAVKEGNNENDNNNKDENQELNVKGII